MNFQWRKMNFQVHIVLMSVNKCLPEIVPNYVRKLSRKWTAKSDENQVHMCRSVQGQELDDEI